jgi:hypothetical protein
MPHKRGIRIDKLNSDLYRLILFGHFSHGFQSQEITNIPRIDLEDMRDKIDEQLVSEQYSKAEALAAVGKNG